MSMEVDLTTPLTTEERNYLHMRGRLPDIERADNLHGVEGADVPTGDGTGPVTMQLGTAEQQVQRREQLLAELRAMGVPVVVKEDEEDQEDTAPPYETWKSADLNAEIDRRNTGRTDLDKISKSGSVTERADRLYVDDEKA
jgi:hypothetical protein